MSSQCKITRTSAAGLSVFRNLPRVASIVLFSPAIIPAAMAKEYRSKQLDMDPFEVFGRALSEHHRGIRHVPYVTTVGFTEIHSAFISQVDAVVTVVCEPEWRKHDSMSEQMNFAESALDAWESKEANAANGFILLQCGNDEFRPPVDASFRNVVESTTYDNDVAVNIADSIFTAEI